jgi:hypothetical protein
MVLSGFLGIISMMIKGGNKGMIYMYTCVYLYVCIYIYVYISIYKCMYAYIVPWNNRYDD